MIIDRRIQRRSARLSLFLALLLVLTAASIPLPPLDNGQHDFNPKELANPKDRLNEKVMAASAPSEPGVVLPGGEMLVSPPPPPSAPLIIDFSAEPLFDRVISRENSGELLQPLGPSIFHPKLHEAATRNGVSAAVLGDLCHVRRYAESPVRVHRG